MNAPVTPSQRAWRLLTLGLAFGVLYRLSNHWSSLRSDVGHGVFEWERAVPFVPWSVVPYLSLIGFFIASFFVVRDRAELDRHTLRLLLALGISLLCYAAFPLRFAFERPATDGVPGLLFAALSAFDLPYNRAPSLHISLSIILWWHFAPLLRGGLRRAMGLWFLLIGISVFTTWQHHLIDVLAGAAVGVGCIAAGAARWPRWQKPSPAHEAQPAARFGPTEAAR